MLLTKKELELIKFCVSYSDGIESSAFKKLEETLKSNKDIFILE